MTARLDVNGGPWIRSAIAVCIVGIAGCGGGGGGGGGTAPTGTVTASACTLPDGQATCESTVSWSTRGASSPALAVDGRVLSTATGGSLSLPLGLAPARVSLTDGNRLLDSVSLSAQCGSASDAAGDTCLAFAERIDARAPTPFLENGQPVSLEVVIFKPPGEGRYPAIMFNHGSTGNGSDPSLFGLTFTSKPLARYFVERGWLVAFPQRRGRGKSDGLYDEGFTPNRSGYSCRSDITLAGAERALADLDAAADWLRGRADVDTTRMLVAGTSRGGILSLAHLARRPDVYLGGVNFVGGWLGEGCGDYLSVNRTLFERGAAFPGRTLWLYGENDSFYSLGHSRANFDAFTFAGGQGLFEVFRRAPGLNGHFLINDPHLWGEAVRNYTNGLP